MRNTSWVIWGLILDMYIFFLKPFAAVLNLTEVFFWWLPFIEIFLSSQFSFIGKIPFMYYITKLHNYSNKYRWLTLVCRCITWLLKVFWKDTFHLVSRHSVALRWLVKNIEAGFIWIPALTLISFVTWASNLSCLSFYFFVYKMSTS